VCGGGGGKTYPPERPQAEELHPQAPLIEQAQHGTVHGIDDLLLHKVDLPPGRGDAHGGLEVGEPADVQRAAVPSQGLEGGRGGAGVGGGRIRALEQGSAIVCNANNRVHSIDVHLCSLVYRQTALFRPVTQT